MQVMIWSAPVLAACALLFAFYKASYVKKAAPGNERMQEIAAVVACHHEVGAVVGGLLGDVS